MTKSNPTKYYSSRQESRIAESLGWSVVSGSGARDFHPGDIVSDKWMGECKTHTERSVKIKFDASVWDKICEEASSKFKYPVLFVDDGSQKLENTWCVFLLNAYRPSNCTLVEYPVTFRKNIVFDNTEHQRLYKHQISKSDNIPIWTTTLSGKQVGLMPFYKFQELFEEYSYA